MLIVGRKLHGECILMDYGKDWAEYNKWELWQNEESSRYVHPKNFTRSFL